MTPAERRARQRLLDCAAILRGLVDAVDAGELLPAHGLAKMGALVVAIADDTATVRELARARTHAPGVVPGHPGM